MGSDYLEILKHFGTEAEIMKAVVSNNALLYYPLSKLMISECSTYREVETRIGRNAADRLLAECLIVFRRLVKHQKSDIQLSKQTIRIGKDNLDLSEYLSELMKLIYSTGELSPVYSHALAWERKLINGQGFEKFNELKGMVAYSLHGCGCTDQQDKEDLFNESLLVLWKKLQNGEAGLYFQDESTSLEQCRIYNRRYYQHSKVGTFLTGIARNLFMNLTRNASYNASKTCLFDIQEINDPDYIPEEEDNTLLLMFLYYRVFIEPRKLRTLISLLQYDCNLEDKDVRNLLGINNTRIHSCRLRGHFSDWYRENLRKIPQFLDSSHEYFVKREEKKKRLNEKIRMVDRYEKGENRAIDLLMFSEEFSDLKEFMKYHTLFKLVFYFITIGKPSALAGLPEEKVLREHLEAFRKGLFQIPGICTLLLLLYYGSDEPSGTINPILTSLAKELKELDQKNDTADRLVQQLESAKLNNELTFNDEINAANKSLFKELAWQPIFNTMISKHETVRGII